MNSNRGQYNSTPLYNLKSKRSADKRLMAQKAAGPKKRYTALSIVLSIGLPVFFLAALIFPVPLLRWGFLAAAAVSVLLMWVLGAFVRSARNMLTVFYLALAVVLGLAMFMDRQTPESRNIAVSRVNQENLFNNPDMASVNAMLNEMSPATPEPTEEAEAQEQVSAAQLRLDAFFETWAQGSTSEMLTYCDPAWISEQQQPEATIFQMLMRTKPEKSSNVTEQMSGSDSDAMRIAQVKARFQDGGTNVLRRMNIILKRVNGVWYVDPKSLDGVDVDEAAELLAEQNRVMSASTIAPTDTPGPQSGITVYYNEDGGKYYHANRTCEAVRSEYWPLTAFSFDLINSQPFKNLKPCTKCNPPERPGVLQ